MKLSKSQLFLIFIFFIILIFSYPLKNGDYLFQRSFFSILIGSYSEINILEISQAIILFYTIYVTLTIRKKIFHEYNLSSLLLRLSLLIFLFYEEISFLTEGLVNFTSDFNMRNQLNIHNAFFGGYMVINNFQLPFTSYSFNINLYTFVLIFSTLFIGYGRYINILKRFDFFFLEKKYSFFFLLYFLNFIFGFFLSRLNILFSHSFIYPELLESFLYIVLLFDTLYKKKNLIGRK